MTAALVVLVLGAGWWFTRSTPARDAALERRIRYSLALPRAPRKPIRQVLTELAINAALVLGAAALVALFLLYLVADPWEVEAWIIAATPFLH